MRNDQPVIVDDTRLDARFSKTWVLEEYGIVTLLAAAIRGRERPWGILAVQSTVARWFTPDDVEFLQSMANVLALAIERKEIERTGGADDPLTALTPRQREVLQPVAEGHSSKDIARRLGLSYRTVETHRSQLMKRLNIHDLTGLVRFAMRAGIIEGESR